MIFIGVQFFFLSSHYHYFFDLYLFLIITQNIGRLMTIEYNQEDIRYVIENVIGGQLELSIYMSCDILPSHENR